MFYGCKSSNVTSTWPSPLETVERSMKYRRRALLLLTHIVLLSLGRILFLNTVVYWFVRVLVIKICSILCRRSLASAPAGMNPLVRDLYKRFLLAGRDYPKGLSFVRVRVKEEFFKECDLKNEIEIKKAIAKGRWWVRELNAVTKFHKYRRMRERYETVDKLWNFASYLFSFCFWNALFVQCMLHFKRRKFTEVLYFIFIWLNSQEL